MNCRRVEHLLSAYVDGELTGVEMLAIRRHLGDCESCSEEYEAVRFLKHSISGLSSIAPRQDFAAAILGKLDEVSIPSYQRVLDRIFRFAHRKLSPVAAALAVSGLALVILSAGGMDGIDLRQEPQLAASVSFRDYAELSPVPELAGSPVSMPNYEPVKVAEPDASFSTHTLELVALTR